MADQAQLDDRVKLALKRYEKSFEYCQPYFDRFLDNYKHYFLRIIDEAVEEDPESYPFYSQLTIPVSYQTVETLLPRMLSRLPTFSITTEEQNDEKDELAFKELIKFQMNHPYLEDDPIFIRMVTALKEEFITGNAWGTVPWYYKEIEVVEWQPYAPVMGLNEPSWDNLPIINQFGVKPQWKLVKVKKKAIDAPVFQHESVFHVLPDPKKKRVSDLGYAIIEKSMTPGQIMDMVDASPREFDKIDELKEMFKNKEWGSIGRNNYDQQVAEIFGSKDYSYEDSEEGQLKVWIMQEPQRVSVIVNEKLMIRDGDNPNGDGKIGLFLMKDIPVPHELYAWGEPDPIKKIEDAITDQTNMRIDSVFYDLLRMWKLDPSTLVEGEEFVPEPGTVVQMKDLSGLQPLETGSTKASAYREYSEWDKILQGITGVTDYTTGANQPGMTDVASGIAQLQQAANARFAFKLQLFEQLGLKSMGTKYVQRNLRFFDTAQMVETENGKELVTPDQIRRIRGNVYFIVDSGSTESVNKGAEIQKWKTIIDMIGKPPFDNLSQESLDEIGRRLLYALGETDAEELMKRVEANVAAGGTTTPTGTPEEIAAATQTLNGIVGQGGAVTPTAPTPTAPAAPPAIAPGTPTTPVAPVTPTG